MGALTAEDAKRQYVQLVDSLWPQWRERVGDAANGALAARNGNGAEDAKKHDEGSDEEEDDDDDEDEDEQGGQSRGRVFAELPTLQPTPYNPLIFTRRPTHSTTSIFPLPPFFTSSSGGLGPVVSRMRRMSPEVARAAVGPLALLHAVQEGDDLAVVELLNTEGCSVDAADDQVGRLRTEEAI